MQPNLKPILIRYGSAILAIVAATALRVLLNPALGESYPFPPFFFAVLLTAYFCGLGPAVLAIILSVLSVTVLLLPQHPAWRLQDPDFQLGIGLFSFMGVATGLICERLRAVSRRGADA